MNILLGEQLCLMLTIKTSCFSTKEQHSALYHNGSYHAEIINPPFNYLNNLGNQLRLLLTLCKQDINKKSSNDFMRKKLFTRTAPVT